MTAERPCATGTGDDIIVCGSDRSAEKFSLAPLEEQRKPLFPEARLDLGGGITATAHGDNAVFPGAVSNRAMVTLKVPF